MLFTIVSIIFLPLSFMASVFSMNARNFSTPTGVNSTSLRTQFKLVHKLLPSFVAVDLVDWYVIVLISLGVIIVSPALAFMPRVRGAICWVPIVTWALISEHTYLRWLWLKVKGYKGKESGKLRQHKSDAFLFESENGE